MLETRLRDIPNHVWITFLSFFNQFSYFLDIIPHAATICMKMIILTLSQYFSHNFFLPYENWMIQDVLKR